MAVKILIRFLAWVLWVTIAAGLLGCGGPANPVYRGAVQDGIPHGKGWKIWPDGSKFEGNWQSGNMNQGVFTWPNGDRYEGGFESGEPNGNGVKSWGNKTYYEGDFIGGRAQGEGGAVIFNYGADEEGCFGVCSRASDQFSVVAGSFSYGQPLKLLVTKPCGTDPVECRKQIPETRAAAAREKQRLLAEAERERARLAAEEARLAAEAAKENARLAAEAEKERARIAAEKHAEQLRIAAAKKKLLETGTAAEVYVYADNMEASKDYIQASEVYRVVVARFPESSFAAAAMTRLGAMRDKKDQQEAEDKRQAAEERKQAIEAENHRKEEQLRRDEIASRKAEAEANKAAAQAAAAQAAAAQQAQTAGQSTGGKIEDELIKQGTKKLLDQLWR